MILEQDSALIKNFITKKDPSMEFNEMQAIIKMLYETYCIHRTESPVCTEN